ncbi:MAG: hypothetical protein FJ087_15745 [Deltaproteobacteria bacterium]|nr:hypothetical protein [Deltaproteobacteria bacterium]
MKRIAFRGSVAAALVMVGVGLLLVEWGVLSGDSARRGLHAWPALLVAFGLEEIWIARGRAFPAFVAPFLVAAVVAALWWLPAASGEAGGGRRADAFGELSGTRTADVAVVDGAYEVAIDVGAMDLSIGRGTGPGVEVRWSGVEPEVRASAGRVEVSEARSREGFGAGCARLRAREASWTVLLPEVPVRIDVDAGACDLEARLDRVPLRALAVDAGASDIDVALGAVEGEVPIRVDAGASDVRIEVPGGAGVRVRSEVAVGDTTFEGLDLVPGASGARETAGYAAATARFDIAVSGGASHVAVVRK